MIAVLAATVADGRAHDASTTLAKGDLAGATTAIVTPRNRAAIRGRLVEHVSCTDAFYGLPDAEQRAVLEAVMPALVTSPCYLCRADVRGMLAELVGQR